MTVEIRPIRTKADHIAALKQIEHLWNAKEGTPDADRLDVLTTLVEVYENEHYKIDPPDPIDAILFRLEQQGLDRKAWYRSSAAVAASARSSIAGGPSLSR